jgi:class 3 adenylate cyclase
LEEAPLPLPSTGERELNEQADRSFGGAPFLVYLDGAGVERTSVLEGDRPLTIGRGDEVDLCLDWDPSISLVHAETVRIGPRWLIGDDGVSRNGTFVNGERLKGRRRLRDGDVIRVGRTALVFNDASEGHRAATTIADPRIPTGTVTMLFTDLVGSTELMDRLGDEAGDRVLHEHFAILRAVASEHDGQEVKSLGDGLMLAFTSALSAIACAVRMQRRIATSWAGHGGEVNGLRIGLNAGEATSVEGDYFGRPVVVAKRLCDQAEPGQILISDVVRSLVGRRGGYRFIALGAMPLKGFVEPVTAFGLDWRSRDELALRTGIAR